MRSQLFDKAFTTLRVCVTTIHKAVDKCIFNAQVAGVPVFDIVLLGLESDGHVASIYAGQERLLALREWYAPCINPYTGQKCVTATGPQLLAAGRLLLLAVGRSRRTAVSDVLRSGDVTPAAYIAHHASCAGLFADRSAYGE